MKRRHIVALLWVVGILLPMGWFTRFSSRYAQVFNLLFASLWAHVLMHAFLFAVLGFLAARMLRRNHASRWGLMLGALGVVLVVACLQEGVQLLYKARALGPDEVLDIAVDSVAGCLGVAIGGASPFRKPG